MSSQLSFPIAIPGDFLAGTKSSHRWKQKPGDPLNLDVVWPRTGRYGIPALERCHFEPTMLAAWHDPHGRETAANENGAIHFFLDDYRFERVWNAPAKALEKIDQVGAALTPDFSLWRKMPIAVQIWQIYRSRWCGVYWQYHGVQVIPTVSWSDPESFEFAFEGLPENSVLAVSALGVSATNLDLFLIGLNQLIDRFTPEMLLCYGTMPVRIDVPVHEYPTFWETRRKVVKWAEEEPVAPASDQLEF